ncbi:MAG TPA: DUF1501 domain-containing protein [Caulobacteraceae bacterium]|jgi:uncharacterized protein (DUF1501 family)|nr:DUF1501 domain-containing protein [Caulobacteraceae bacterium]
MTPSFTRRALVGGALGVGVTLEFAGSRAFAAVDRDLVRKKLVVIVCRGGLDGLSLSPPVGDPAYAALRGPIAIPGFGQSDGALKLDETFGLHPAMVQTYALAQKGQARIVPAVATPDRERSHFEAQDVLESGVSKVDGSASGWLNRALQAMGPAGKGAGISVGPTAPLILRGPVETASWSPGGGAEPDRRLPGILQDLYAHDPQLSAALATGLSTEAMAKTAQAQVATAAPPAMEGQVLAGGPTVAPVLRQGLPQSRKLGATLAAFMTQADGKQVAAVSIDNFDTHANQGSSQGQLATRLAYLDAFIGGLADGLGPAWNDTVVVSVTEFGRTARVNGTNGTDHGTASTALLMGGAIRRGGIVGDWPTLQQAKLFENRDTAPTVDLRGLFKGVLAEHLGLSRVALDGSVFPDSARVAPVAGLV